MNNLSDLYGDEFCEWVRKNSSEKNIAKGEYLAKVGEEIEYIYFSDKVNSEYQTYSKGKELVRLDSLESYELSGLDSILTLSPPITDVVSISECKYTQIPVEKFSKYIDSSNVIDPNFIIKYAQVLSKKLQSRNDLLANREKEKINELKKILLFFGDLDEIDISWFQKVGRYFKYKDQEIIIEENKNVPCIYIILSGFTSVFITRGEKEISVGQASKGEILGEMSLLLTGKSQDVATASVAAIDNADLIAIDKNLLRKKLNNDKGFSYRFYLSISRMLSFRLRDQLISSGLGIKSCNSISNVFEIENDDLDLEMLSKFSSAGSKFDSFCRRFI
jgi:bacteriocin-type transport-associated protein